MNRESWPMENLNSGGRLHVVRRQAAFLLLEGFAEVAQAVVADLESSFGDIEAAGPEETCGFGDQNRAVVIDDG